MSTQPEKFDAEAFRRASEGYIEYLRTTWKMAIELAESSIAPPRQPDDEEVVDIRRAVVYDLAARFFDKICLDTRDVWAQAYWQSKEGE